VAEESIGLTFIARQLERVIADQHGTRDDLRVLTAIVLRLDGTFTALLTEVNALHAQLHGFNQHFTKLETIEHDQPRNVASRHCFLLHLRSCLVFPFVANPPPQRRFRLVMGCILLFIIASAFYVRPAMCHMVIVEAIK
jgi:hypothetical protein